MITRQIFLFLSAALLSRGQLHAQCATPNHCLDFDPTTPSDYVETASSPVTGNSNFTVETRFFVRPLPPASAVCFLSVVAPTAASKQRSEPVICA